MVLSSRASWGWSSTTPSTHAVECTHADSRSTSVRSRSWPRAPGPARRAPSTCATRSNTWLCTGSSTSICASMDSYETYVDRFFSIYDYFDKEHAEELLTELRDSPAYARSRLPRSLVEGHRAQHLDRPPPRHVRRARPRIRSYGTTTCSTSDPSSYLSGEHVSQLALAADRDRTARTALHVPLDDAPVGTRRAHVPVLVRPGLFQRVLPFLAVDRRSLKSRHVSFHFLLNGPPEEINSVVERRGRCGAAGRAPGRPLDRYADNISFSMVSAPDDIAEPRTFYACSRFLFARRIAHEYQGPLVISDIDLFFREDPKRYLDGLDLEPDRAPGASGVHDAQAVAAIYRRDADAPFSTASTSISATSSTTSSRVSAWT